MPATESIASRLVRRGHNSITCFGVCLGQLHSLVDYILVNYKVYLPFITKTFTTSKLLLYISFNSQQTPNGKLALISVYIYYLNKEGCVVDYMLTLPMQLSQHLGINYTEVISNVLNIFKIIKERLSYFITNNAHINNTCLNYLAVKFSFNKAYRRTYYAYYILNLVTQQLIFSKNKKAFKNKNANILKEEEFLKQQQKEELFRTLYNLINLINMYQLIQLFVTDALSTML